jgi:ABC-type bacteriocin/lantibiotic exporter with double-glycine peptidase domain
MVVAYQRRRNRGGELKNPSEVKWIKDIYDANHGISATIDEREKVARALGFRVLNASMSAEGIWEILQDVPIIYAGHWPGRSSGHFVVLVGISGKKLAINNPASGMETCDYYRFAGKVLLQSAERPLIYP